MVTTRAIPPSPMSDMHFRQRSSTQRSLLWVPNSEFMIFLCLMRSLYQICKHCEALLMVLLSDELLWSRHYGKCLLNLISIRGLLLIELEFLAYLINNMIVCIHGLEILYVQLVPLIGSLRKDNRLLLFIPLLQGIPQLQWVHLQHLLRLQVWMDMVPYNI